MGTASETLIEEVKSEAAENVAREGGYTLETVKTAVETRSYARLRPNPTVFGY
ncbi:MAG: hypothetical protein LBJ67_06525 [Planctomycetaceae bacterium]|nr:hypothetical protein [Planctomycetaceae bacterium]